MQVELNYGRGQLPVILPAAAQATIVRKPAMPVIRDIQEAVERAFNEPVNCSPLNVVARRAESACIAVCDLTRPVPNRIFLRPLIERLMAAGIARSAITVLVATGLHRPNLGEELAELIGDPWVLQYVTIANHDAKRDDEHVMVGVTGKRGTVVRLDRRFVNADVRIVTGLVEPHFMAGYSGGRKVIAPGLAHAETIATFHNARFMADPGAANCNLLANPLHEEQLEIAAMLGDVYAVNTAIDEQRRLSFINFGELIASHRVAVEATRSYFQVPLPRRFSTVLTCGAGAPLDTTYYQTIKGMVGALHILEPGGDLVIASSCSEGFGSPEFKEAQHRLLQQGRELFLQEIHAKPRAAIDEWQTQMQIKAMLAGDIHLYTTGLSPDERRLTGVNVIDELNSYLAGLMACKLDQAIAVIPEGPYVVPIVGGIHG